MQAGDRVLVRNLTPREGSGKLKSFWEKKVYIIEEVKDPDGLVYTVREQDKPNNKSRTLHRNNILPCHNLPHNDQYSTTKKDTASSRKSFKLTNSGNKTEESKLSSDEEKSSSSDEESEIIDHIRSLKYRGIGLGKVRSRQPQKASHTDKKVQESKQDKIMFERDVVSKKEAKAIAETERTQPRGNSI